VIVINWDWVSFVVGIFAVLTVQFWLVIFVAFKQWRKAKKSQSDIEKALNSWVTGKGKAS